MLPFMCQLGWVRYLVKHYFWMCLWGCFWKRLAFELVDWVRQITLLNVGGPLPICWALEWNKTAEEGPICPVCLTELGLWSPCLRTPFCPVLRPSDLDWNYTWWIVGFLSLHSHWLREPILIINMCVRLFLFLGRTLADAHSQSRNLNMGLLRLQILWQPVNARPFQKGGHETPGSLGECVKVQGGESGLSVLGTKAPAVKKHTESSGFYCVPNTYLGTLETKREVEYVWDILPLSLYPINIHETIWKRKLLVLARIFNEAFLEEARLDLRKLG